MKKENIVQLAIEYAREINEAAQAANFERFCQVEVWYNIKARRVIHTYTIKEEHLKNQEFIDCSYSFMHIDVTKNKAYIDVKFEYMSLTIADDIGDWVKL